MILGALVLAFLTIKPLDSNEYRRMLEANRGHILLVAFWATWCEPCREELPRLRNLALRSKGRARLITISADAQEQLVTAGEILKRQRISGRSYWISDAKTIDLVDPKWSGVLPALFVYRKDGSQEAKYFGEVDWRELERLIAPIH